MSKLCFLYKCMFDVQGFPIAATDINPRPCFFLPHCTDLNISFLSQHLVTLLFYAGSTNRSRYGRFCHHSSSFCVLSVIASRGLNAENYVYATGWKPKCGCSEADDFPSIELRHPTCCWSNKMEFADAWVRFLYKCELYYGHFLSLTWCYLLLNYLPLPPPWLVWLFSYTLFYIFVELMDEKMSNSMLSWTARDLENV